MNPPRTARLAPLATALLLTVMIGVLVYAASAMRRGSDDGPRQAFDPLTTDRSELRRVTEAISRVIAAPPDQHEAAVETLEAVRAESAGARDLKDACVNTYRSTIRAQQGMQTLYSLIGTPDAGEVRVADIPMDRRMRALELQQTTSELIELAQQSMGRCLDLYGAAVRTLGLVPAERFRSR